MMHMNALSALLLLPLVGMALVFALRLLGPRHIEKLRWLMLAIMGGELLLTGWLYAQFDGSAGFHFTERVTLSRALGAEYFVGVDGISLAMIALTTLLAFVGVLASWSVKKSAELYWAMYCLAISGMLGVFIALDLLLFFAFWLLTLVPFCVLVGVFGGEGRKRAASKLALTLIASSGLLLFAILALHSHSAPFELGDGSLAQKGFSIPELARVDYLQVPTLLFGTSFVKVVFVALFLAFASILGIAPFHASIIDAIVEAPIAIRLLMAGAFIKIGGYGLLRIGFGILPEASAWAGQAIAILGVSSLFYFAIRAMMQSSLERFVAHASFAPMGLSLLAMGSLTPAGIQASVLQIVSHGVVSAMLFLVASKLDERVKTNDFARLGGLLHEAPAFSMLAGLGFFASVGAPGSSAFLADTMTLAGAFPVHTELSIVAGLGMVLVALFYFRAFQRVFLGDFPKEWRKSPYLEAFGGRFPDIRLREALTLTPLAIACIVLGFWPRSLLGLLDANTVELVDELRPLGPMQISLFDAASRVFSQFC